MTLWRKSSFSHDNGRVTVADLPDGGRLVRDLKDPDSPVLCFTPAERDAFLSGVRAGEFD